MIYLFCNSNFGSAFQEEFLNYDRLANSQKSIVFSANRVRPTKNVLRKAYRASKSLYSSVTNRLYEFVLSRKYGVKVMIVNSVNSRSFQSLIRNDDHGIISGFNQIFAEDTIRRFQSLVNFHPSLLPYYRGPVPSYWCIKNGEDHTGFTLHRVTAHIDQGEILYQESLQIHPVTDPDMLDKKIAQSASQIMVKYLDSVLGCGTLEQKTLNAREIYKFSVDYASFPGGR